MKKFTLPAISTLIGLYFSYPIISGSVADGLGRFSLQLSNAFIYTVVTVIYIIIYFLDKKRNELEDANNIQFGIAVSALIFLIFLMFIPYKRDNYREAEIQTQTAIQKHQLEEYIKNQEKERRNEQIRVEIDSLEKIIADNPNDLWTVFRRGQRKFDLGLFKESSRDLEKILLTDTAINVSSAESRGGNLISKSARREHTAYQSYFLKKAKLVDPSEQDILDLIHYVQERLLLLGKSER